MAYIYGSPVTGKDFYGRKELLDELVQFNATETYFLNGIRRIGKSSVLKEVERRTNEQGYLSIYLDLMGKTTPKEHGEDLGRIIENRLAMAQIPYTELEWVDFHFNECISKWAAFCRKNGKKSFILIDEAEKIHELPTLEIEKLIRNIKNTKDVLQIILTGTFKFFKLPENRPDLVEFQALLQQKYIGCLSQNEIINIIQKNQETGGGGTLPGTNINIVEADFNKLWHACGGHPYLIQYFCAEYYNPKNNQFKSFPNKLTSNQQLDNIFQNDFELFNSIQQRLIRYLPVSPKIDSSVLREYSSEISELQLIGIITSPKENKYKCYGYIFEDWMHENQVKKRIYVACADADAAHFNILEQHLTIYIRSGRIDLKWANNVNFGTLQVEISNQISISNIGIFILSHNTWTDERVMDTEMPLVEQFQSNMQIIPIHLTPGLKAVYSGSGYVFDGKQALPKRKDSIKDFQDEGSAWADVAQSIIDVINSF